MPKIIRKKRFLLNHKLPNFYNQKNEIIHLAYDFDEESIGNSDYVEHVQIAVEEFNACDFAKLIYRPVHITNLNKNCSIDEFTLRKKHLNQIVFGQLNSSSKFLLATTWTIYSFEDYIHFLRKINNTIDTWSAFAWIDANTANPKFQSNPVGILLHEIYHLFGIRDLYRLPVDCWNGILYTNITAVLACETIKKQIDSNCSKLDLLKNTESGSCSAFSEALIVSPVSLFSMHQYSRKTLAPFYLINKTRISELLNEKHFTEDLQEDYFELLEKYQGCNHFVTYQDILALVKSIYLSAPDSLLGRNFSTPNYYSVKAVYRPLADEEKFNRLITFFKQSENFNYPILAQENLNLSVDIGTILVIDLAEKLKIVNLTPQRISCSIENPINLTGTLQLSEECILTLYSQTSAIYQVNITLKTNSTVNISCIRLTFSEKARLMDTLLLGNPSVEYRLSKPSSVIDLIGLCRAIGVPRQNNLQCISTDLPNGLFFSNCSISGMESNESYNFTVNFSNKIKNKTCRVQFLAVNNSVLNNKQSNESSLNYLIEGSHRLNETGPLAYFKQHAYENILLNTSDLEASARLTNTLLERYIWQLHYLFALPMLHGFFEGCVDGARLHLVIKLIFKIGLSLLLVSMNYFSNLQLPFLFFYYISEFSIIKHLTTVPINAARGIQIILFFIVTELEYGFSNLWLLADKPIFWSALNDHVNKFFLQMLWIPLVKSTGYLLSSYIIDCLGPLTNKKIGNDATSVNAKADNPSQLCEASFFNSLKIMKNTISFKNIKRLPSIFYKQYGLAKEVNTAIFLHNSI
ncbi:MAG: hypothetical protein WAL30_00685 [Candidatus Aquirickettsiella sp.]